MDVEPDEAGGRLGDKTATLLIVRGVSLHHFLSLVFFGLGIVKFSHEHSLLFLPLSQFLLALCFTEAIRGGGEGNAITDQDIQFAVRVHGLRVNGFRIHP